LAGAKKRDDAGGEAVRGLGTTEDTESTEAEARIYRGDLFRIVLTLSAPG
jgi:hypothetical protein